MNHTDAHFMYFENKDHYLAFRKAWAASVANPNIRLTAAHHMLYNLLRGKNIDQGFTDRTNVKQIYHQRWINFGAGEAQRILNTFRTHPRHITLEYVSTRAEGFLIPFDGTVTPRMLVTAVEEMPTVEKKFDILADDLTFDEWLLTRSLLDELNAVANELIANQKPLDPDMAKVLHDNIWELYT